MNILIAAAQAAAQQSTGRPSHGTARPVAAEAARTNAESPTLARGATSPQTQATPELLRARTESEHAETSKEDRSL
jgi:hypothetical protein